MRGLARAAVAAALVAAALPVRADTPPSVWDIAKDPPERDRWALHVRVQRLLTAGETPRDDELRLQAARAMLEDAGAATSPDVRLRFDLGIIYGRLELRRRAVDVLVPALEAEPDHPAAAQALDALVYAYAKMNQPADELATWRRYIPRLEDDRARAPELMNMGEAEMRLGLVDDALGTFREVLRLCAELPNTEGVISTQVLTLWDLAVALDRSGDPRGAVETATKAKAYSWQRVMLLPTGPTLRVVTGWSAIHETEGVFFVPEWERDWYLALGATAGAFSAKDARDETASWALAEQHWGRYVAGSSGSSGHDPWLPIARLRLEHARAQHAVAQRSAARLPPRPDSPKTRDIE
jgi:tetratricopeptide (TPR) repeat protein